MTIAPENRPGPAGESRRAPAQLPVGMRPGTAACLSCEWRSMVGGYAVSLADTHARETGHAVISRGGNHRNYGTGETRTESRSPVERKAQKAPENSGPQSAALWEGDGNASN